MIARRPSARTGKVRIGISGWRYAPWRGKFYPEGLRQADELAYASGKFSTIEINGTSIPCSGPSSSVIGERRHRTALFLR